MARRIRFRNMYMVVFSLFVIALLIAGDPDQGFIGKLPFGAGAVATIILTIRAIIYVALLHMTRRALFDYIDLQEYFVKAKEGNVGAGIAVLAICVSMLAIAILISAAVSH